MATGETVRARERVGAALVSRRPLDRLHRPHRGGRRAHRRHAAGRGGPPRRAGRHDESSAALVGTERGVVARWPRHRVRLGDAGSRERARRRRPDGDHAVPVQADGGRGADALQRQQAAARVRRRPGHARASGSSPTGRTTSIRSTGRRRAIRSSSSPTARPAPDKVFNYDIFTLNARTGASRRLTTHEERRVLPGVLARRHAYRVCRHDARPHLVGDDDGGHARVGDAGRRQRARGGGQGHRQSPGAAALVSRRPAGAVHGAGARPRQADGGGRRTARVDATSTIGRRTRQRRRVLGGEEQRWPTPSPRRLAPAELFVTDLPSGHGRRHITTLNRGGPRRPAAWPRSRRSRSPTTRLSVEAFLTVPSGSAARQSRAAIPLIVMIHGGPHGQQGPAFNAKAQAYAGVGWATLMVNYRGSDRLRPEVRRRHLPRPERRRGARRASPAWTRRWRSIPGWTAAAWASKAPATAGSSPTGSSRRHRASRPPFPPRASRTS